MVDGRGLLTNKSDEAVITELAYVYDGSLEGLLTAIFVAYRNHEDPSDVVRQECLQLKLGQQTKQITTDINLALRVQQGIRRSCGSIVFDAIKGAYLSEAPEAGSVIYRFVRHAMSVNKPLDCASCSRKQRCGGLCSLPRKKSVLNDLTHPTVEPLQKLNRMVYNERHKMMEFLRFEHMENGLWVATCNPKASVVPLIMDWFTGRFNTQPFVIYDENHGLAGVYEGKDWHLVETNDLSLPDKAEDEKIMSAAWKRFYDTVAVESRYNPELRRSFMPKRLWKNIVEMQECFESRGEAQLRAQRTSTKADNQEQISGTTVPQLDEKLPKPLEYSSGAS